MRSKFVPALACILMLCAAAAPALAQSKAAAQAPDAKREALARRYIKAANIEKTMDAMLASLLPVMAQDQERRHPGLTAEDRKMLEDILRETSREFMMPRMIDKFVPIYARTFTTEELEALVAFYEAPLGRSITDKAATLAPASAQVMREVLPEMQEEMARRLCARIQCETPTRAS